MKKEYPSVTQDRIGELENEISRLKGVIATIEERYRNFFEKGNDGICYIKFPDPVPVFLPVDDQTEKMIRTGYISECNKALAIMYGYSEPDQLTGKTLLELYGGEISEFNFEANKQVILSGYQVENVITKEIGLNGEWKYYSNTAYCQIKDDLILGVWCIQKDITEEVLAKKIRDIQLRIATTITGTNTLGEVIEIIRKVIDDLIDSPGLRYIATDGGSYSNDPIVEMILKEGKGVVYTAAAIQEMVPSGEYAEVKSLLGVPVATSDEKFGVLMVCSNSELTTFGPRELSLFEILARELAVFIKKDRVVAELIRAREKAEEMNRVKSNFLANMSHELRTPLLGILGYAELIEEEVSGDPELTEMVNRIVNGAKRLHDTVSMILDYSSIEEEIISPHFVKTEIVTRLRDIFELQRSQAEKKGLKYFMTSPSNGVYCNIDIHMFNTLIDNLINNAIKFTPEGEVELGIKTLGSEVRIIINDTGIGISQAELDHIWGAFRQASEGLGRDFEGNGLGLTVANRFAELMDATIGIESEPGRGTSVSVTFPLAV